MNTATRKIMQWIMPLAALGEREKSVFARDDCIRPLDSAPIQFSFSGGSHRQSSGMERLKRMVRMFPTMRRIGKDILLALDSLDQNPVEPQTAIDDACLQEFEGYARALGVGTLGYTRLPREALFKGKAIFFNNVIMLAMEMDRDKINAAPSDETLRMTMDTYYRLGQAVNSLVDFLRSKGFAAQAGHPLGGQALYPLMAEISGMGLHGRHGMLITPRFGPRQRLAAIYCSITNLPTSAQEHTWIADFCRKCGRCIRTCPPRAICEKAVSNVPGIISHIDSAKCFSYFSKNHGCSLCIKECAFNKHAYADLKKNFTAGHTAPE